MDSVLSAESPAHHRYPVWWTGDGVDLQGSVQSMVDSGVHNLKPFVHSDCGGDYRGTAGDLLRWTAHCVFGTILRFHGNDHRPWTYDQHTLDVIRQYLEIRYKLAPSLIAAGKSVGSTGMPFVARGDLFWPQYHEATSNDQYIHLTDTLVAPIFDSKANLTSRSVWVPPGDWQDVWDGSIVTGPKTITATQPYERQPMWHRRGGLVVAVDDPALRVEDQDWSELVLHAFPDHRAAPSRRVERNVVVQGYEDQMVAMDTSDDAATVRFTVTPSPNNTPRSWKIRVYLAPGQSVEEAEVDGAAVDVVPVAPSHNPQPFGDAPPVGAGGMVELSLPASASARHVVVAMHIASPNNAVLSE